MSGRELVGPVPTIRFHDGQTQIDYAPRNTLDIRYKACTAHRLACNCREAEMREQIQELRNELRTIEEAAVRILAGHSALAWRKDEITSEEQAVHCMCTGCQIARAGYLTAAWTVSEERLRSDEPEVPF